MRGLCRWWMAADIYQHGQWCGWSTHEASGRSGTIVVCSNDTSSLRLMWEEGRIMTVLKEVEPLPAYLSKVSLQLFLSVSQWDFPMCPSGVYWFILHGYQMGWSLLIRCLVCNPSGNPSNSILGTNYRFGLRGVLNGTRPKSQYFCMIYCWFGWH